ncbi:MAG: class I SAM-dependent methyltransferase [Methylobacteriaceae bacterium]|nr:class I SAM-dependent methyltransferase [Methylobacteriaceae bacterium]
MTAAAELDVYAENMFGFEQLHPRWIEACARYLRHIFGSSIEGKLFLDYAFGRGNWSLAALRAGAAGVVAIDAAAGNVRRFSDYCREHGIANIEILHGDILREPVRRSADILWVYGILPCIAAPDEFLARLSALRRDDDALALLYAYDRGSLRQVIVDAARQGVTYDSEHSFAADSYLFTPKARLRARDDLTAPLVTWFSAASLAGLAARQGMVPLRQCPDFRDWMTGRTSEEFAPHHLVCGFQGSGLDNVSEPERPQAGDFAVLGAMADTVMARANSEARRKLAVGLFNTHFSALSPGEAGDAVIEDFLFLMHAALRLEISPSTFDEQASFYVAAALAAARDAPRHLSAARLAASPLARHIEANTLRF